MYFYLWSLSFYVNLNIHVVVYYTRNVLQRRFGELNTRLH